MIKNYDDIIDLPRHRSTTRSLMEISKRVAQFAPFAALTGHDAAIKETARVTQKRIDLDAYVKEKIDERLQILRDSLLKCPEVKITYFSPDESKDGGAYIRKTGVIKKIDHYEGYIFMTDGTEVCIEEIVKIEAEMF